MKLPSSPLIAYTTIYSILFLSAITLHLLLIPLTSSALCRVYIIDLCVTCILFLIGNFLYSSNNIYDLHWPLLPLICSIYYHFTLDSVGLISFERLPLILLICLWSLHLTWQTVSSSDNIHHEDWRYQTLRKQYESYFLVFAFLGLHILPMLEVLLGSSAIFYIYRNMDNSTLDILFLFIILSGVLLENIADRQLKNFRRQRQKCRQHRFAVLSSGLWKYSRHPNYLGEIIFWWGLFFLGYVNQAPWWCGLSPLLITLMMLFGSIPMSEERMFRKYPEYKSIQQRVPKLFPTFGFLE